MKLLNRCIHVLPHKRVIRRIVFFATPKNNNPSRQKWKLLVILTDTLSYLRVEISLYSLLFFYATFARYDLLCSYSKKKWGIFHEFLFLHFSLSAGLQFCIIRNLGSFFAKFKKVDEKANTMATINVLVWENFSQCVHV